MKTAPIPYNESKRLADLKKMGVIYTPSEHRFDRITDLACQIFYVPICLVSLVAGDCQWFKSVQGLTVDSTSREVSFCAHAILQTGPFVVENTAENPAFSDNPLVINAPHIAFYAGAQLVYNGSSVGTLCIIDTKPRTFSQTDRQTLESLAKWVENELRVPDLSQDYIDTLLSMEDEQRHNLLDAVTGCWNAEALNEILPEKLNKAGGNGFNINTALIKIENYEHTLLIHGQESSDFLIKKTAHQIKSVLRITDSVFRLSADSFFTFVPNCPPEMMTDLIKNLSGLISNEPYIGKEGPIYSTLSIDTSYYPSVADIDTPSLVNTLKACA